MSAIRPVRWWLHGLLLAVTLVTTSVMGAAFVRGFRLNQPVDIIEGLYGYLSIVRDPGLLVSGLPFSLTLLSILFAHEMGHFGACKYYKIDATAPFFIPFPAPIGTFGAFIRIRAPIFSKRALFDVAVAGPLAGFFLLLPALAVGVAWSKVIPGIAEEGEMVFGTPLIVVLLEKAIFPGVASSDIYLHPIARAAWVGVLATALNLLPIGQLDGGHILYSFVGERSRILSRVLVAMLIPLGLLYSYSWLVWAAFLFFFGMRHPAIFDARPLGRSRTLLGWLSLALFVLCFTVEPIRR
ncbi:MAG: site-2 protease family protein [Acidobacteria bacterium]|nr:site-2 protease family protein [Acidobacteriota bacterium]